MIPVAANDVAFSIHTVLLTAFTLFQIFIYERKNQKISKISIGIVFAIWLSAVVCTFVAIHRHSLLWLISVYNAIQVTMTVIKYIPQAVLNFRRKSTDGFSIGNILLDLLGGLTNYGQMTVQSIDQKSWVRCYLWWCGDFNGKGESCWDGEKVYKRSHSSQVNPLTKGDNNPMDDSYGIYADGQLWLENKHVIRRVIGYLPYVGWTTIIMTEQPLIKLISEPFSTIFEEAPQD